MAALTLFLPSMVFASQPTAIDPIGTNIADNSGTVYMIATENGQTVRRPYTSAGAFLSYGFNSWSGVSGAGAEDLALPIGSFVPPRDGKVICSDRGSDNGTCYLITDDKKAGFTSAAVFANLGFSFAQAGHGDVSWMSSAGNIDNAASAHSFGVLVNNSGTIQLVGDGGLLGIPDLATLESWGYSLADVVPANSADKILSQTGVMTGRKPGELDPVVPPSSAVLTVISPSGGEQWAIGSTQTVKWSAPASVSLVYLTLSPYVACLYQNPRCMIAEINPYPIAASVPNTGNFNWVISAMASDGRSISPGQYLLNVSASDGSLSGRSAAPFTITNPATANTPVISNLSPSSGPVGTQVTITGSGFTATGNTIQFDIYSFINVPATNNGSSLTFYVPSTLYYNNCQPGNVCPNIARMTTVGDYAVSVSNNNGTSNAMTFTVSSSASSGSSFGSSTSTPVLSKLNPSSGPVDTMVTITGSGFTPTGNKVKFGNQGSESDPNYSLNSPDGTTVVFPVPSTNYSSCWYAVPACKFPTQLTQPGAYEVSVINANGTSNAVTFTVTAGMTYNPGNPTY